MKTFLEECADLLKIKHNIIVQGAPGTGKTYNTAAIALKLLGVNDVDLSDHAAVMEKYSELQKNKRIFFTTFHQSLDYEDFVEGLRPEIQKNEKGEGIGVTYKLEDGIFKRACDAASRDIRECIDDYCQKIKGGYENHRVIPTVSGDSALRIWWIEGNDTVFARSTKTGSDLPPEKNNINLNIEEIKSQALRPEDKNSVNYQYNKAFIEAVKKEYLITVLIIDEINRGNVSKIFGELITLLESDKRAGGDHPIEVTLPYSKTQFAVPDNLYIIGTMNTTDRSTGTLDYALRRRFAFVTLKSDRAVIEKHWRNPELKGKATGLFDKIKSYIEDNKCGDLDIDDLMIGHSYFMASEEKELEYKVKYEIKPLLTEYFHDGILDISKVKPEEFSQWLSELWPM